MFGAMTSGYGPTNGGAAMGNSTTPNDYELQKMYTMHSLLTVAKRMGLMDSYGHSVRSQNAGMQMCLCF